MPTYRKRKLSGKIWIEHDGNPLIGKGGAEILERIEEKRSISRAAETLGMSYRYVWNYIRKIGKNLGKPVVETYKGGRAGGGGAKLTSSGQSLLEEYKRLESCLSRVLSEPDYSEVRTLKISARNRLKGKVVSVEKDGLMAKVKVEVTEPTFVTAIVSREAAEDLGIKAGDRVEAVVKATEVMIAK